MYITSDRRGKPRIDCDCLANVAGVNEEGQRYREEAKLRNLSASGLFMMVNRHIEDGTKLAITVHLSDLVFDSDAPKLATNGVVVRCEPQADGSCGVAVKFQNYRFV